MDILIVGPSGSGKSKLGDFIRNTIFKLDKEAKIVTKDPDRENKTFGEGKNIYSITIEKLPLEDLDPPILTAEELGNDIVIILTNDLVKKWFNEVYES